jgi:glutamate dehydrogenase
MEADLLWLGGIGTYIKAAAESDAQAGDKANDALRVNAEDLRVKVVGEGANLGVTQRGRIAFAARGGRINTDFIDNSAGVDCSDNEVNIKILLNPLVNDGKLAQADRDSLLVAMTDDVSALVLRDNYLQTAALSIEEARAPALLASYARLIRTLERSGGLNRAVEQLPSDSELDARAKAGRGLTRPELAVLLAYAKMRLYDALLDSAVPDAAVLQADLAEAFPQAIRDRFIEALPSHRLRREIIATKLANAVVNRGGPTLVFELAEASNSGLDRIAAAFVATRAIFDFRGLWRAIDGYDYRIPAATQIALQVAAQDLLRGQMLALVAREPDGLDLDGTIAQVKDGVAALLAGPLAQAPIAGRWQALAQAGAPADVLAQLASLDAADAAAPLASRAVVKGLDVGDLYAAFDAIGEASGLDALVAMVEAYRPADAWEQLAIQTLGTDLMQTRLDHAAGLPGTGAQTARAQAWIAGNGDRLVRLAGLIDDMRAEPAPSLAMFTHAVTRARGVLAVSD